MSEFLSSIFINYAECNGQVGSLHAVMSDKEYNIILNCFYMNLCEQPTLPPSFRSSKSAAKDTIRLLADKVNMNSQVLLSRTVTIMTVKVAYALLELCHGTDGEAPLAHVIVSFSASSGNNVCTSLLSSNPFKIGFLFCSLKGFGYRIG